MIVLKDVNKTIGQKHIIKDLSLHIRFGDVIASVGHGTLGIALFLFSAGKVGIEWNLTTIIYYIGTIIGGILIQGGMFIIFSALSFYFVETNSIKDILYWNMRKFAGYPISIYSKVIQGMMIYVVPFAFVNYFPAQYLLRKPDMEMYLEIYMYMAPVVGVIVYGAAYIFWRISVKRYFCKDKITLSIEKDNHKIRLKLLKFLVEGKACCHLVDDER